MRSFLYNRIERIALYETLSLLPLWREKLGKAGLRVRLYLLRNRNNLFLFFPITNILLIVSGVAYMRFKGARSVKEKLDELLKSQTKKVVTLNKKIKIRFEEDLTSYKKAIMDNLEGEADFFKRYANLTRRYFEDVEAGRASLSALRDIQKSERDAGLWGDIRRKDLIASISEFVNAVATNNKPSARNLSYLCESLPYQSLFRKALDHEYLKRKVAMSLLEEGAMHEEMVGALIKSSHIAKLQEVLYEVRKTLGYMETDEKNVRLDMYEDIKNFPHYLNERCLFFDGVNVMGAAFARKVQCEALLSIYTCAIDCLNDFWHKLEIYGGKWGVKSLSRLLQSNSYTKALNEEHEGDAEKIVSSILLQRERLEEEIMSIQNDLRLSDEEIDKDRNSKIIGRGCSAGGVREKGLYEYIAEVKKECHKLSILRNSRANLKILRITSGLSPLPQTLYL